MNEVRTTLRLPEGLHNAVANLAQADRRSLNQYLVLLIEDWVKRNKKK